MLFREMLIENAFKILTDILMPDIFINRKHRRNLRLKFNSFLYRSEDYKGRDYYKGQEASDILYEYLTSDKPCLIARFGAAESRPMRFVYKKGLIMPKRTKRNMARNAGFFPATKENLIKYGKMEIDLCKDFDVVGLFFGFYEADIITRFCTHAKWVSGENLSPINDKNPFSRCFAGKKILVIHPFVESIRKQYEEKRERLFKNPLVLPEFDSITYKPVQSIADEKDNLPYKDWFEALDKMKEDISKIDFDIAIIGAGAYGIFLGQHCKKLGKKAIYMGGVTQMLFGVMGRRWQIEDTTLNDSINAEEFISPSENEIPKGYKKVEEGAYW